MTLTYLKNSPLRIFWQIPESFFLLWLEHTFFSQLFFYIFLPESRLQIFVFHFFMHFRDLFLNFDSNQQMKLSIAHILKVNEKFCCCVASMHFSTTNFFAVFFTQIEISNVNFNFFCTSETCFFSVLTLPTLKNVPSCIFFNFTATKFISSGVNLY